MKRKGYISWEAMFIKMAYIAAERSKDPKTQVGAVIVRDNMIVGVGYNGFPRGCSDDTFPWERTEDFLQSKDTYVCHAELNAIANAPDKNAMDGATMYVTLFPCNQCAKYLIQSGIQEVVYVDNKYYHRDFSIAARRMFDASGVTYRQSEVVKS